MVINKKPGMVVHPAFGNWTGTLANAILHHIGKDAEELDKSELRPGIVHRLDKNTSGLIIVAKNPVALHRLARQFADRKVIKIYKAMVWGVPNPPSGTITTNIGRSKRDRKVMANFPYEGKDGKTAITDYSITENLPGFPSFRSLCIRDELTRSGHTCNTLATRFSVTKPTEAPHCAPSPSAKVKASSATCLRCCRARHCTPKPSPFSSQQAVSNSLLLHHCPKIWSLRWRKSGQSRPLYNFSQNDHTITDREIFHFST